MDFTCQFKSEQEQAVQATLTSFIVDQDYLDKKEAQRAKRELKYLSEKHLRKEERKEERRNAPNFAYMGSPEEAEIRNLK